MSESDQRSDDTLQLSWKGSSFAWDRYDPEQYLQETRGEIQRLDDDNGETVIGRFRLFYVDILRAIEANIALVDVLDAESATIDYFWPLFGSDSPRFRGSVLGLSGDRVTLSGNLVILDRVEILPRFRGRSLGLAAMTEIIARFAMGAAIVAIKPFPLQFEARSPWPFDGWRTAMECERLSRDQSTATAKLVGHFSKLGFVALSRTPFMVRTASD